MGETIGLGGGEGEGEGEGERAGGMTRSSILLEFYSKSHCLIDSSLHLRWIIPPHLAMIYFHSGEP